MPERDLRRRDTDYQSRSSAAYLVPPTEGHWEIISGPPFRVCAGRRLCFLIGNRQYGSITRMDILKEIVTRVVEVTKPHRVILFGSMARGDARPDSDVDLLVVVADGTRRLDATKLLHRSMFGIPAAVDFVVATESDLNRNSGNIGLIYRTILREGRILYAT